MAERESFSDRIKKINAGGAAKVLASKVKAEQEAATLKEAQGRYRSAAIHIQNNLSMPVFREFAQAIPGAAEPTERSETKTGGWDYYEVVFNIPSVGQVGQTYNEEVKLSIRPASVTSQIHVEGRVSSKGGCSFVEDFPLDGIDDQKFREWLETNLVTAYEKFCE